MRPPSAPKSVDAPGKTKDLLQSPPKLELPKGGGAIRGIGEKFQANPATGTAGLSIPLPLTPGRNGFTPSLSLSYDSGSGNSPFGLGWGVGVPSVRRKTYKGLPTYHDATDEDTFVLSEAEDLVPMRSWSGSAWADVTSSWDDGTTTWSIRRYRPRVDAAFSRIERWTNPETKDVHWRTITRENVTRIYGKSTSARLSDPDNASHVFEWKLEEERDEVGNVTQYVYDGHERDDTLSAIYERNRGSAGNGVAYTYLKRVRYANASPGTDADGFFYELVFDYGDHTSDPKGIDPESGALCPVRQDPFSGFRPTFETRCYRLCRNILLFHRFPNASASTPTLVRTLALTYDESPTHALLTGATLSGTRDGTTSSLPTLTLGYQPAVIDDAVQFLDGLDDLPQSLDISRYQWVDLDGEGLSGLLSEQAGAWWYKRNEGGGALGAARMIRTRPSFSLQGGDSRLSDVDGDGRLELVHMGRGREGFATRTADGGWADFRRFRAVPNLNWNDPNIRQLDLDGDGIPDVLVTEHEAFTWYRSEGADGWEAAKKVWKKRDEEKGPTIVFSSERETIFLADMNGDGLTDLVRVRNGSLCYWPNRGYGRFGAKVAMQGAPRFDSPDRYDPKRLRLADLDGSGPADLLYLGPDKVRMWFNQAGNSFSAVMELPEFPGFENPATVSLADLLGNGTSCLVWSSPLRRDGYAPIRYIELMAEGKPYLLQTIENGLGRTTTLTYTPSTQFYVDDRDAQQPWATRLHFPVQCLSRVAVVDNVTGWRMATRYAYHHGYFDGSEREFRGFGKVEQWDAETLTDYQPAHAPAPSLDLAPVRTVTWFHTGAWKDEQTLEAAFAAEYFVDADAMALSTSAVDPGDSGWGALSVSETREAARALKGKPLRQEVYAEDGLSDDPYVVTANRYTVVRVQAKNGEVHPVFRVDPAESVSWQYERSTDPRTEHTLTLDVDAYGNILQAAKAHYGRRSGTAVQQTTSVVLVTESTFVNDTAGGESGPTVIPHWHVGVPVRQKTFAVTLLDPSEASPLTIDGLIASLASATTIDWDEVPSTTVVNQRLVSHALTTYFSDDLTTELAAGTLGIRALIYQKYLRVFTDAQLTSTEGFHGDVDGTAMAAAGYVVPTSEDGYWAPSGTRTLDAANFYVVTAVADPFGNTTTITWDAPLLFPLSATDALGNTSTATIDYTAAQPSKVMDPNGNWTRATFDGLGRVTTIRVVGQNGEGDPGDDDLPDPLPSGWPTSGVADPTVAFTYELSRWGDSGLPARVHTRSRQAHGDDPERWYDRYTYSDGGGNIVQEKVNAAPDPDTSAARFVGTGRVVLNNKGKPVRQYEPFFAADDEYEFEDAIAATGVTALVTYDPVGRPIQIDLPNGTRRRVTFTAWEQATFDENDCSTDTDLTADAALLARAAAHANTPTTVYLDAQGRPYATDEMPDVSTTYTTAIRLDVVGNPLKVWDERGRTATTPYAIQTQSFDMLGRPIGTQSPDGGDGTTLLDVLGQPVWAHRSGDLVLRFDYDALRRPTHQWVTVGSDPERLVTRTLYGEGLATPSALNHAGRPYRQYDTAGVVTTDAYDFKGNALSATRRFWGDPPTIVDWSDVDASTDPEDLTTFPSEADAALESGTSATSTTFDALNRVVTSTTPDTSITAVTYGDGGQLEGVDVFLRGAGTSTAFVTGIAYNAKGQRTAIVYGNGVKTAYSYDADTFRLIRLRTTRSAGAKLQNLTYTYDPVGNIVSIVDAAQDTLYFNNTAVRPANTFSYDALYRLITAAGRERVDQGQPVWDTGKWASTAYGAIPDAANAVWVYAESYTYDAVGNITAMDHAVPSDTSQSWTRAYAYATDSNRLASTTEGSTTRSYTHNARGSLVYLSHLFQDGSSGPNIRSDFRDQMVHVLLPNDGDLAQYFYDANGQRVRKIVKQGQYIEDRRYVGGYEVWSVHPRPAPFPPTFFDSLRPLARSAVRRSASHVPLGLPHVRRENVFAVRLGA